MNTRTPIPFKLLILTLLLSWFTPVVASAETFHITPAGNGIAVLRSTVPGNPLQITNEEISGRLEISADSVALSLTLDMRYLSSAGVPEGRYTRESLYEALTYPHPALSLNLAGAVPGGSDSARATLRGTISRGDHAQPVQTLATLSLLRRNDDDTTAVLTAIVPVDAEAIGVNWRHYNEHLADLHLNLTVSATKVPYRVRTHSYEETYYGAYRRARELRYPETDVSHFVAAGLGQYSDDLLRPLRLMGIDVDSLRERLEAHLLEESPRRRIRGRPVTAALDEIWHHDAHMEAFRLGSREVTPVHALLALLCRRDHPFTQYLAGEGITYTRLHALYEENPQPAQSVTLLGNPFYQEHPDSVNLRFARNVWDMQLWRDRIYFGSGNSSNLHPARNAGPVPVISWNLETETFQNEFTVNEEQIHRYRTVHGKLLIPGHDPEESWRLGNFYRLRQTGWEKVRTIPLGIHTYDILGYERKIFVGQGTSRCGMISWSDDDGQTWQGCHLPGIFRAYELFVCAGELYATCLAGTTFRYTGGGFTSIHADLYPDAQHGPMPIVARSVQCGSTLLYIGADNVNDHQWKPFAAYRAGRIDKAERLDISGVPYDILVHDGAVYILTNRRDADSEQFTVVIYRSENLDEWTEVVRFPTPAPARSFEYARGAFYVGLGTETAPLLEAAGNIYRVIPPTR